MEELVKYAAEMGSGAMVNIPSLLKIGSGIQKFTKGGYLDTERIAEVHFHSFKIREVA
jgi:hypothetical protein